MSKKTRTEYSLLNIATGIGGYALNTILGIVCRVVFTKALSADYLGINGLFTNILSMLSLAELGIGSAIVYALYKPLAENDQDKITALVQFYGKCYRIIGCVVAVIGIALSPFLDLLIREKPVIKEDLRLIYFLYLFNTASTYFFSYRSSLISAAQQHYIVSGISYIIMILQSVLQIIWLLCTHEYIGYLIISSIGTFIFNLTISGIAKKKFPYITRKDAPGLAKDERNKLVKNVRALTVWKLSGLLVNSTDNIIITYFKGLAAVGFASNYTMLSGTLNSLVNLLFNGIGASIGNLNAVESKEKRRSMFYTINLANFWMFGWAAIGMFVVSSDLVLLLFGEKYVLPRNIPLVIALNFYMVGIQNAVWSFQNAMGLFRQGRYMLLLTAAINLGCSIWLGTYWGLFGILIATAISRLLTNTWYDPYKVFRYGFGESVIPYYRTRIYYLMILVITGSVCYFLGSIVSGSILVNVVYKFAVCCIVPNAVFWLLFHRKNEYQYYRALISRILKKLHLKK